MKLLLTTLLVTGCASTTAQLADDIRLDVRDIPADRYCPEPGPAASEQVCVSGMRDGFERGLRDVIVQEAQRFACPANELRASFRLVDVTFSDGRDGELGTVEMTYEFELSHVTRGPLARRSETLSESYRGTTSTHGRAAFVRVMRVVLARVGGAVTQAAVDG
jgi:hypothetical protein